MMEINRPTMNNKQVIDENRNFYAGLYRRRGVFGHLFRLFISFDQQSKAKPNLLVLSKYLESVESSPSSRRLTLLDFGSGWGAFLLKLPKQLNLYCFDLSETAMDMVCSHLRKLGRIVDRVSFEQGFLKPQNLDYIVCSHVLEHVDDDLSLLRAFSNALVDNGLLLVNVPINEVWDDPKHVRKYDMDSLVSSLNLSGFDVIEIAEVDKWTGFLLENEDEECSRSIFKRPMLRTLRALLAVVPWSLVLFLERTLLSNRDFQQLIIVAKKKQHKVGWIVFDEAT